MEVENMKKNVRILAVIMAAIFGLTACSSSPDTSKQDTKSGDTVSEKTEKEIELTVSHYYQEEERSSNAVGDSYLAMVDKWQDENPDITLTQQTMSQSDYSTKIQAQAAANEVPDVFMVKGSWIDNFAANDIMAPINDYLDQYEHKDAFREGVFDVATRDGQIYGLPNQLSITSVVYYNDKLWKSIGYDTFPDNWEDIFAAAKKFNDMGIATIGLGNAERWPAESCILSTLGDRYTGMDWTNSIIANDGQAKFTDQAFVSALKMLQELSVNQVFNPDFNTITETQSIEYYAQEKAASVVSGHWTVSAIESFASEELLNNTKVSILPAVDGGKADSISGGCGWYFAVNKNLTGAKLDAAMDFIFATNGYDMCEYAANEHGIIGAAVIDNPDQSKLSKLAKDFIQLVDGVGFTPVYDLQMNGAVIEVMNTGIQELLNDTKTPEDLAAIIQAQREN
jgi:raffinose/stachyose/melibiose transport system substrate-binding protein